MEQGRQGRDDRPPIALACDVLVVGGGAAGLAAAVTAARQGLKVTLLERYGFCGGAAVAGLSGTVCGMYEASTDDNRPPVQAVFGFLDEFVARMEARGGLTGPIRYGKTFTRVHDPLAWRETADDLLADAGVHIVYHTVVTEALCEGDRIEGIRGYTKEGPLTARAKLVIDASGDADLAVMAGLPCTVGDEGRVQNPTMIFRMMGADVDRLRAEEGEDSILGPHISELIAKLHAQGEYVLPRSKIFLFPTPRPNEILCNVTRVIGRDGRELNPLIAADLTEAEIEGRKQVRQYERFIQNHIAGCADAFVNDTGVQVGVRQTRQIVGTSRLANADVLAGRKFDDGIARSPWPIELHSGAKPRLEWLMEDVYEVPYGCFVPKRGEGILVAGRCLSAEHEALASARVTAQCFSYGHAIGHAAAIAVKDGVAPRDIDGRDLRQVLNRDGARLG
ncbi:FAD-dependent oxidoreductase [Xanthobacter sp. KR7-65]|uniref:FAD-dependent oxidoreductase n=1 Tax=Xanthobacter sp. KR7-65 TaxID=3156612 RepID=UPI0032B622A8